ncbi:hypothetical protein HEP_00070400 [Hepatocystis sp. ex Piliocolobus tephrosceles]|nr:hypothetical protein HEP_00070400 [Hepatocystis sp. ex Piliocolobus tephrosceles]
MKLQHFLFFNALLYSSCVLTFKINGSFILTDINTHTPNKETNYVKAAFSNNTNLLFTNKNDFVKRSDKIFGVESMLSLLYLVKMKKPREEDMRKFIIHVTFGEFMDKKEYDRENAAMIRDVKTSIKHSLQSRNISYDEHKINSMVYRILQRIIDFNVFYTGNLSLNDFISKEREHTKYWLQQISNVLGDRNFNIQDYYIQIRARIENDSIIKKGWDKNRIHNIACRIMQVLSDLLFVDSSGYKDLVQIK